MWIFKSEDSFQVSFVKEMVGNFSRALYLGRITSFLVFISVGIGVRGGEAGGLGGLRPLPSPRRKKNSIIQVKLMYRSGKDTVKNNLLFNILIYLFSSRNSPNLVTDICTTSRHGCYYSELEH